MISKPWSAVATSVPARRHRFVSGGQPVPRATTVPATSIILSAKTKTLGFTLIEVVLTILLVALASAMLIPFMGNAVESSAVAPIRIQRTCALDSVMAGIMTNRPQTDADLSALRTRLMAAGIGASFVTFPTSAPYSATSGGTKNLRVTVTNSIGQRLTTLFAVE
ncbi:MAG: type II secretion system protein [Spartobacteria bacterium]|nr:type II secretion system protein [Spartobacteria bacterium]